MNSVHCKRRRLWFVIVFSAVGLTACRQAQDVVERLRRWAQEQREHSAISEDNILAKVGDKTISVDDFLDYYNSLAPAYRKTVTSRDGRRSALQNMISLKATAYLARRANLERDPEYVKTVEKFKEGLLFRLYLERLRSQISVSPEEVKAPPSPKGTAPADAADSKRRAELADQRAYQRLGEEEKTIPILIDEKKLDALSLQ